MCSRHIPLGYVEEISMSVRKREKAIHHIRASSLCNASVKMNSFVCFQTRDGLIKYFIGEKLILGNIY